MKHNTIKQELDKTGLSRVDAVRLILECTEAMGERTEGLSRLQLLAVVRRILKAGIEAVLAAEQTVSLEEAAWASVAARKGRRPSTVRDLRYFVHRMLRVEGVAQLPLRSITTTQCRQILESAFGHSPHGFRKARVILHSIFAYGARHEWCDSNPVSRIEVPAVQERPIIPLSTSEVRRLQEAAARPEFEDMRFSLSLLLYSGVRPAEVERLTPDDICWAEQQVIIRPQKSKTGGGRMVPLRMLPGLSRNQCRVPANWKQRWLALRRAAGFQHWVPDICRHTFASYHATYFRNLSELQLEMGHRDLSLLRSRYMTPASKMDALHFWQAIIQNEQQQ